jgi:hypothetical protein
LLLITPLSRIEFWPQKVGQVGQFPAAGSAAYVQAQPFQPILYERAEQGPLFLAQEILALTKMNWNNTQFDNFEPITLKAARKVGSIFKYMKPTDPFQSRYSFYM